MTQVTKNFTVFASGATHAPCLPLRSRGCWKLKLKAKGGIGKLHDFWGQALTDPSLPSPSSLPQAHSSCLLAGAIRASPAPHHEPKLLWPAQLLTITGAAARLDLLRCGLRTTWPLGPCWVPQDLCSPFHSSTRHQTFADSILQLQTKHQKKKVVERYVP